MPSSSTGRGPSPATNPITKAPEGATTGEDTLSLDLVVGHPGGSRLVEDFLSGDGTAAGFYPRDWRDPDDFRRKAAEVDRRFDRAARERAAAAMGPAGGPGAERLERWIEEGGYLVTTGQQPGLFGGPLYSVYKALTAARLAESLEAMLDRPVLPLFWVASEDHDWDEAHDTWLVGVDNELHHLALTAPGAGHADRPLFRVPLGPSVEAVRANLLDHLPATDFIAPWRALLDGAWTPQATVSDAFRATMETLLGSFGVLFVDAHDPALKAASADALARELEGAARHEKALAARAADLEAAGYHVQVPVLEGGVNLFFEGEGGRERLYRDDGSFHLRHSGRELDAEDVARVLQEEPGRVSPNVLLRPVVESVAFPTLAYVAGPGEIAYFAQLEPLFEAHGVEMPVIYPRFSVTAVESKVAKVLDKFGLDIAALDRPFHELAGDIARDEVPPDVQRALGKLRGAIGQGTAELTDAARAVDPTLKGPISHVRSVAFDALAEAERKILHALKRENDIALQQLEKARLHLFPNGKPQERVINPFYYLARYGDRFLQDVAARMDPALPSSSSGE